MAPGAAPTTLSVNISQELQIDDLARATTEGGVFCFPHALTKLIDECITKCYGLEDASKVQVKALVYHVDGKRIVLNDDMDQTVEVAGVRMTTLEAQRRLAYPDFVKAIVGKSEEEKARLRAEKDHQLAAKTLEFQRLSE